jgi:sugar lactone lactonase YvrE
MPQSKSRSVNAVSGRLNRPRGRGLHWRSAALVALLLPGMLVLSSCIGGNSGLPGGLPFPKVASLTVTPPGNQVATDGRPFATSVTITGGTIPINCTVTVAPATVGMTTYTLTGLAATNSPIPTPSTPCQVGGTIMVSPTITVPVTFTVTVSVTDSGAPPATISITFQLTVNPAFSFTSFAPGTGEQGVTYSQMFMISGGTGGLGACTITGLPGGTGFTLTFTALGNTCTLMGTPTAADVTASGATGIPVTITAKDCPSGIAANCTSGGAAQSTTTAMANLIVVARLTVSGLAFPTGEATVPYSLVVSPPTLPTITGGVLPITSCAIPGLPAGLSVAPFATGLHGAMADSCQITGTPGAAFGPTSLTLTVMDSATNPPNTPAPVSASGSANFTVAAKLTIPPFTLGNGEVGVPYSQAIPPLVPVPTGFSGGILPVTNCSFSPPLPAGLVVAPFVSGAHGGMADSCQVTGTPTAPFGPSTMTLSATDSGSKDAVLNVVSAPFTAMTASTNMFQVFAPLALPTVTLGNGEVNALYSSANPGTTPLTITGGNSPFTCTFNPANPVAGLTVAWNNQTGAAAACVVAGTPTAAFSGTVTVQVMDTAASTSTSAATVTTTSNSFQIFSQVAVAATLGNGEVNALYNSTNVGATEPAITGGPGSPTITSYTCAFVPAAPPIAGLNIAWNGLTGAAAGCTVSGTPTATFGPGTIQMQVTENQPPSAYSAAGVSTAATSNSFQIFPALAIAVTLGNGEINALYNSTNLGATEPKISGGNPAATSYTCAFTGPFPTGLTATWNGSTGVNAGCTVAGTPTALFGPATVMIQATEGQAPSSYSAAGVATGTSNSIQIYSALSLTATLGNGEVNALYNSTNPGATEPLISGGNPATTAYACTFTGASPAGLTAVWNGSTGAAAGCTVSGTPSGTFGPATTTIQVTDMMPSPYSAVGSFTATSNSIQIFPQVTLAAFTLGDGETGAGYAHTGIAITNGNQPYTMCTATNLPAGLAASVMAATNCQIAGTPTATAMPAAVSLTATDTAPSAYSAAGVSAAQNSNLNIFPGITFNNFTLGNGVNGQPFAETVPATAGPGKVANATPPTFTGGNTGAAYTCAASGAFPAGLGVAWNGTSPTPGPAACNVTGTPSAAFGLPAGTTVNITVTDTPRSADQRDPVTLVPSPSTITASSQANFLINNVVAIMHPALVPNDLVNTPYSGITFSATGGITNGGNVNWTPPGGPDTGPLGANLCTPPGPPPPTAGLPTGLTLGATTGSVTGTPSATGVYTFMVCVEDNTGTSSTAAFGTNSTAVTIKILGHLAFISGTATHTVEVVDSSTNAWVASIPLNPTATPTGIALNAEGGFAYVADSTNNVIWPIDTVALTAGAAVPIPSCTAPLEVATSPDPVRPGNHRLFVSCPGSTTVGVFNISTPAAPTPLPTINGVGPSMAGIAISGDNALVLVASPSAPGYYVIDNALNPPALAPGNGRILPSTNTNPTEIAIASNGGTFYAYISTAQGVEVDNLSGLPSGGVSQVGVTTVETTHPDAIAIDPVQSYVFVTLPGTNQFDLLDNTSATPGRVAGAPFNLPISGAADPAGGVAVAPSTGGGFPFEALFTVPSGVNANTVAVVKDNGMSPFATDFVPPPGANPIPITTPATSPGRIAVIPVPASGLGVTQTALPDAVAARTYNVFAVIKGGVPGFTCAATNVPAGFTVTTTAVPSGPLAGKPACLIAGTAGAAGMDLVEFSITDNSTPPQVVTKAFNLNVRQEFAFTNSALPVAVQARSYGLAPQTAPLEATTLAASVGAGPLTACLLSGSGATSNPNLASNVSGGTNCDLSSSGSGAAPAMTTTTAGAFQLTYSGTDTGITDGVTTLQAVPPNTVAMASPVAFTVNQPLMIPMYMLGNGEVAAGYGQAVPTNLASGGGLGPLASCSFVVVPGGLGIAPAGTNCSVTGPPSSTFGPLAVTITAMDTGNSAVPAGTAMGTSSNAFQVFSQVAVATVPLGDGEVNATYSNTGGGTMPISITGGNPASTSYTCAFVGGSIPAGLKIAWNGMTGAAAGCTVTGAGGGGVASATFGPNGTTQVQVMDTAPSTSSGAGTSTPTTSSTFTIFAALSLNATLGNGEVGAAYNSTFAGATEPVFSGGYGAGSFTCTLNPPSGTLVGLSAAWNGTTGCTVSGTPSGTFGFPAAASTTLQVLEGTGVSAYSGPGSVTATSNTFTIFPALSLSATLGSGEVNAMYNSTNAGATEPAISGGFGAATYICAFSGPSPAGLNAVWNGLTGATAGCTVSGTPTATFGPATTMMQVTEGTGASNYSAAGTFTATSNSIQIFPQVTLAALPQPLAQGTTGTAYGPVNDAISSGNPPYTACTPTGFPAGMTIMLSSPNCVIAGTPTATLAAGMVSITATDTAASNYSAAGVSAAQSSHLTIVQGTVLAPTPTLPTGVTDRAYSFSIAITNGQSGDAFTCTGMNLPTGLTVAWNGTMLPGAAACNITNTGAITATAPAGVTVTITATDNVTTSAASVTPTLIVNPELQIQLQVNSAPAASLPNGLVNIPYGVAPASTASFVVVPNTGDGTAVSWFAAGSTGGACTVAPGGTLPAGVAVGMGSGAITGTPSVVSTAAGQFTFNVCVSDAANTATPAGSATATGFIIDVMNAFAYAAGSGTNTLEVIGTQGSPGGQQNASIASVGLTSTPNGVAVTPNGRYVIVTEDGPDQLDVFDTITTTTNGSTPITGSPFALTGTQCGTPVGVAADAKFIYVVCDSTAAGKQEEVLVLNTGKFTAGMGTATSKVTELATGAGTVPDSVAFKNDDTRAYVTLSAQNQIQIIDNTMATPALIGTPFTLSATSASPRGITVAANPSGAPTSSYAYVAKQTGGISFVAASSNANCANTNNGAKTVNCSFTVTAGDTVVVMVAHPNTASVSTIADNGATGGNTYTARAGCSSNNTTTAAVDCFTSAATKSATTITVTLAGNSRFTVSVAEYSGVTAIGNTNANNTITAATNTASVSLTTQDNSNVCVGGFNENGAETINPGATGINVRTQISDTSQTGAIVDISRATPGSCTVSANITPTAHTWAAGALELRGGGNGPGVDVVDVTTDTPSIKTMVPEQSDSKPFDVAQIPGTPTRVYVTLPGTFQFDALDNTTATPASITSGPFDLHDSRTTLSADSGGVTIPPFASGSAFVYFTSPNFANPVVADVQVYDDGNPPAPDGTTPTIPITNNSAPGRIASVPIPH